MAYKLQLKRGVLASLPNGSVGEPLFTTDTFDLYVGKGDGTNVKIQKFIASGSSSQFLKGDGSLDSNTYIGLTALSASAPLSYNNTTGAFTISQASGSTNGYLSSGDWTTFNAKQAALSGSGIVKSTGGTISYLTDNSANWDSAYNDKINSASVSGTTTKTLTLTQQDGGTITASWSDYDTAPVTSVFGRTGVVVAASGDYTTSLVTEGTNLYFTDARARAAITLTTTGSSGSATYVGGTLNVPTYTLAGLGGVPTSRSLTINGTSYDLSADRSWSVGTVTSVDLSVPTGFAISGNPITSSGTLALAFAAGYSLPTTSSQANWDAAYNDKINSASVTGTTTKTLTLTQQDGGTITASWTDDNTDAVSSVFGRTGAVVAQSGDYTTTQVTEGTNLYYTEARVSANTDVAANTAARHSAVTIGTANGLSLSTQQLSLGLASGSTTGALSSTDWTTFNSKQAALNGTGFVKISGTTISYDNSTYYLASNPSSYIAKTDLSAVTPLSYDNVTGVFQMTQANSTTSGYITSTDWNTFNNKQSALTNPVTGTGTTNYVTKWTSSSAVGNSLIYDDGSSVGIGTTSFGGAKLAIQGGSILVRTDGDILKVNDVADSTYWFRFTRNASNLEISNRQAGALTFLTSDIERLRITSSGNVGIGTTSPTERLTVANTGESIIRVQDLDGTNQFLHLGHNGGDSYFLTRNGAANGNFTWYTSDGTTTSERMRITSGGNVGIGTTSPSQKLDVNGYVRATSGFVGNSGLSLFGDNSSSSVGLFVTSGGNLLVGTSTDPGSKLYLVGSSARFENSSGSFEFDIYSSSNILRMTSSATSAFIQNLQNNPLLFGTNATERMRITSGGDVGIGTTNPFGTATNRTVLSVNGTTDVSLNVGTGGSQRAYLYASSTYADLGTIGSLPITFSPANTERMRITSGGDLLVGASSGSSHVITKAVSVGTSPILQIYGNNSGANFFNCDGNSSSSANTGMRIGQVGATGRSINAGGTINASGADYAEYMTKAVDDIIAKGDIVGVDKNGLLTNIFIDAISFVVKSTNPSYVGGDNWGKELYGEELEKARQKVDRIAFSGQVPCNIYNSKVGDYIIPINVNGKINGQAISNPTFEQYQKSIGRVWKIMDDGRAWIVIKII